MNTPTRLISGTVLLLLCMLANAQTASDDDAEDLKIAALEALMSAPPERALPIVRKVLNGNNSDDVKERALFLLSQIDRPEAQALLLEASRQGSSEMRGEAIRMIGIGGNDDALAGLIAMYETGDEDVREAILEAYLIADRPEYVYQIALATDNEDDYDDAVETLAAIGAREQLQALRNARGMSESLIEAYVISSDYLALREISQDSSDPEMQKQAIEALGSVDGPDTAEVLVGIYRSTAVEDVREAVLEGLMIGDQDEAMLELYRSSDNPGEKKELLEYLVMMDSDAVWDLIDAALEEQR